MAIDTWRVGSAQIERVRIPPTLDGDAGTAVRTVGTVHLLTSANRPICKPDGPTLHWVEGVGWDGVGMWQVHCALCEELRQAEQIGGTR